jgi:hypothetical protein
MLSENSPSASSLYEGMTVVDVPNAFAGDICLTSRLREIPSQAFERVLGEVEAKFNQSAINPEEMCGTLGAQSVGEPGLACDPVRRAKNVQQELAYTSLRTVTVAV